MTDTDRQHASRRARELLEMHDTGTLLRIVSDSNTINLSKVDHIFTDADGTVVEEGHTTFSREKVALFATLHSLGVGITIITGKPLEEAVKLRTSLPPELPISLLCEKGAYQVHVDNDQITKTFVLSSDELERQVARLREEFTKVIDVIVDKYRDSSGAQTVWLGWSGIGQHKSILGIDIYGIAPPANYLDIVGSKRDELKLQDLDLRLKVEKDLEEFVFTRHPDWRVVHMGNGNTEITPGVIEKDTAITQTESYQHARNVLVLGDSFNDQAMFELSRHDPKIASLLVLHRKSCLPLVEQVDYVAIGMANSDPLLTAVILARKSP